MKRLLFLILLLGCVEENSLTRLEKHKLLYKEYNALMEYHISEQTMLDDTDLVEKELKKIHIDLAKDYAKLILKEKAIIQWLEK